MSAAGGAGAANADGYLTGIVAEQSSVLLKGYRDIYHHDPICGSAVDLQSELPFSDFSLYGVDEAKLEVYNSAIANLNMRTAAAQMTRHYLVEGAYASTLVFDSKTTTFTDQIPYAFENLKFDFTPLVSQDPIITAKVEAKFMAFLNNDGEHFKRIRKLIPAPLLKALKGGDFTLDPLSTLYMSRRPFISGPPISYLQRVYPTYLIEKSMYRGTMFELSRRQRANVHVTAGDELWEPTPEELSALANVFQQTDLDPMGAIVVTRNAVQINEFRSGGDFYKWMDAFDIFTTIKLKALGISDALLSADSTYNNSDSALVVLMENFNAYREYFTHCIFTNKMFPLIAMVKGYRKDKSKENAADNSYSLNIKDVNDHSQLDIPRVRWSKRLVTGNDANLFDSLEKLSGKGVPVPMRLWIAASGLDADVLLNELKDDDKLDKKFSKFKDKTGGSEGEQGEGGGNNDLMQELSGLKKLPLLANDWGNLSDATVTGHDGKVRFARDQTAANRKINEMIARSAGKLAERGAYERIRRDLIRAGKLPDTKLSWETQSGEHK